MRSYFEGNFDAAEKVVGRFSGRRVQGLLDELPKAAAVLDLVDLLELVRNVFFRIEVPRKWGFKLIRIRLASYAANTYTWKFKSLPFPSLSVVCSCLHYLGWSISAQQLFILLSHLKRGGE